MQVINGAHLISELLTRTGLGATSFPGRFPKPGKGPRNDVGQGDVFFTVQLDCKQSLFCSKIRWEYRYLELV